MGLDQYAYKRLPEETSEENVELAYWRKHNPLQALSYLGGSACEWIAALERGDLEMRRRFNAMIRDSASDTSPDRPSSSSAR